MEAARWKLMSGGRKRDNTFFIKKQMKLENATFHLFFLRSILHYFFGWHLNVNEKWMDGVPSFIGDSLGGGRFNEFRWAYIQMNFEFSVVSSSFSGGLRSFEKIIEDNVSFVSAPKVAAVFVIWK